MSQFVSMLPWAFYCYFQGFVIGSHVQDPFISLWYFRLNLSPFQIKATQILNGIALNVQVIFDRNKILAFLSLLIHKKVLYLFRLTLIFLTWFCGFHCLDLLFNSFIIYIFYTILSETAFLVLVSIFFTAIVWTYNWIFHIDVWASNLLNYSLLVSCIGFLHRWWSVLRILSYFLPIWIFVISFSWLMGFSQLWFSNEVSCYSVVRSFN